MTGATQTVGRDAGLARSRGPALRRVLDWGNRAAGVLVVLALWQILPSAGVVSPRAVPPFGQVAAALAEQLGSAALWTALGETVTGWAVGLAIAAVGGIVVGLAIGAIPYARQLTESTVEFLRPIPSVALIPLVVLIYGSDLNSDLVLVIYASFWQVLIQVLYGMQDVDPVARETARSYRLGWLSQIRYVTWPTALPYVITGLRLAATVALVLEITAELVIGGRGLGSLLSVTRASGAVAGTYALVVIAGLLGLIVNIAARKLETVALPWHHTQRSAA